MRRDYVSEADLHDKGVEIISRLVSLADRLTDTASELRLLADTLKAPVPDGGSEPHEQ